MTLSIKGNSVCSLTLLVFKNSVNPDFSAAMVKTVFLFIALIIVQELLLKKEKLEC